MKQNTTKSTRQSSRQGVVGEVSDCAVMAVDLAKNVFQVAGENSCGEVILEAKIKSREAFWRFIRTLPAGMPVLMEPGPGAQAWARQMQELGVQARLLPAQRVAEHRSGSKNDRIDAHAILRAGHDRNIHPVPIKSAETLSMQAMHRVRTGYVRRRTAVSNQMRGLLLEQSIALPKGDVGMARVGAILEDATQPLPYVLRELIAELLGEWGRKGEQIKILTGQLERVAKQDPVARRLMSIRGVGPVIASAMIAKDPQPERFSNGRMFAAYFGTVPHQHGTAGKVHLGKMSKRGDAYLRSLLIEGAHAVLQQLDPHSEHPDDRRLQRWMSRLGRKGAAVRLANRNLRTIWSLLQREDVYRRDGRVRPHEEVVMAA